MIDTSPLARVLGNTAGVALAVLFGSASRDADGPASDLDVGVLYARDDEHRETPADLGVALERACGRPVDLVVLNDAPPLLRFEIARDGILLVERTPHAWSGFRARAAVDWWDWAPIARRMFVAAAARARTAAHADSRHPSPPGGAGRVPEGGHGST